MNEPARPPHPTRAGWGRIARRLGLTLVAVAAAWLALALHPQPLFASSARRGNVVLHMRGPVPPQAGPLLDDVVRRVSRSPLYDPARVHHVFLCDTRALFGLFALWRSNVGGLAQVMLSGNIFIRPSNLADGRVIGPSGNETPGERTLAYFIAHEVTHAMTADRIGRLQYRNIAAFQAEGYADYVSFDHRVDLAARRRALEADAFEMSPRRSGLYARYELLVAYLLEKRGMTVDGLLGTRLDQARVESDLLRATSF